MRPAAQGQQLLDDAFAAEGFFADDLERAGGFILRGFVAALDGAQRQLGVRGHDAQGVIDLMSDARGQQADAGQPLITQKLAALGLDLLLKIVVQVFKPGGHAVEVHRQLGEFEGSLGIDPAVEAARKRCARQPVSSAPAARGWSGIARCR